MADHLAERHVRHLQREVQLPGLPTAEQIQEAAGVLVEADRLREPVPGTAIGQRTWIAYAVNRRLVETASNPYRRLWHCRHYSTEWGASSSFHDWPKMGY
jgi:hypothetical protein